MLASNAVWGSIWLAISLHNVMILRALCLDGPGDHTWCKSGQRWHMTCIHTSSTALLGQISAKIPSSWKYGYVGIWLSSKVRLHASSVGPLHDQGLFCNRRHSFGADKWLVGKRTLVYQGDQNVFLVSSYCDCIYDHCRSRQSLEKHLQRL